MGKRKRRADHNKTPPPTSPLDLVPYSSQMDSLSKEKSSRSVGTNAVKPLSSIMEIVDSSMKLPNAQLSPAHRHHHNHLSRTVLLRHPRHYYGRQYSRRNSANHAAETSSTSHHRKCSTPLRDDKLSFKLAAPFNIEPASHSDSRERASRRPERIRSSSSAMDAVSPEVVKMVCGLCHKLLKRKPYVLESTLSSSDVSVVAVLVCGHAYHADCLETRTRHEDRRDPPCPFCLGPHLHSGPPGGQE